MHIEIYGWYRFFVYQRIHDVSEQKDFFKFCISRMSTRLPDGRKVNNRVCVNLLCFHYYYYYYYFSVYVYLYTYWTNPNMVFDKWFLTCIHTTCIVTNIRFCSHLSAHTSKTRYKTFLTNNIHINQLVGIEQIPRDFLLFKTHEIFVMPFIYLLHQLVFYNLYLQFHCDTKTKTFIENRLYICDSNYFERYTPTTIKINSFEYVTKTKTKNQNKKPFIWM